MGRKGCWRPRTFRASEQNSEAGEQGRAFPSPRAGQAHTSPAPSVLHWRNMLSCSLLLYRNNLNLVESKCCSPGFRRGDITPSNLYKRSNNPCAEKLKLIGYYGARGRHHLHLLPALEEIIKKLRLSSLSLALGMQSHKGCSEPGL